MAQQGTVLSSPIPLYQNLQIDADFYKPSRFVISSITLGPTTLVETSVDHNYVIGQEIRLLIPPVFGCYQLNESKGYVLSMPADNQVIVSINSSENVDPFIASSDTFPAVAQILAIGNLNSGAINTSGRISNINYIPGSFLNISPQ